MNFSKILILSFLASAVVLAFLIVKTAPTLEEKKANVLKVEALNQSEDSLPKLHKISSFHLTNQENKPYGTEQLKGKTWVVNFVFTRCQGPCPLITKKMKGLQDRFKGDSDLNYLSITMDSGFDKPDVLKNFGKKYHADFSRWNFLTGDQDEILSLARNIFKVPADKNPEMHTTRFILVDSELHVRGYYNSLEEESFNKLSHDIEELKKRV